MKRCLFFSKQIKLTQHINLKKKKPTQGPFLNGLGTWHGLRGLGALGFIFFSFDLFN